jgi:Calcineurin-like phosphoesterase
MPQKRPARHARGCHRKYIVACLLVGGCRGHHASPQPPAPVATDVESVVFLVGDGGDPDPHGEPVLDALRAGIAEAGAPTTVLFLGDNIYPAGMPPEGAKDRAEAERRLRAQVDAGRESHTIFVPGNHDWNYAGTNGWATVVAQETYGRSMAGDSTEFLPGHGCAGPAVRDVGDHVRIIVIDTQWWLRGDEPGAPAGTCAAETQEQVLDSIRTAVATANDRRIIVAGHHPLVSGGTHGGHFTLRQHIFPLTDFAGWLWLPLPVIGSAYPVSRMLGISNQDLSSGAYQAMRDSIAHALDSAPLVFAAGHEHGLQVLRGIGAHYQVVSGAGIYGHLGPLSWIDRTLFAAPGRSGYARLDVQRNGRVRLAIVTVDAHGGRAEVYSIWLE